MTISTCCGASPWYGTDICSECREHTDFEEVDEEQAESATAQSAWFGQMRKVEKQTVWLADIMDFVNTLRAKKESPDEQQKEADK